MRGLCRADDCSRLRQILCQIPLGGSLGRDGCGLCLRGIPAAAAPAVIYIAALSNAAIIRLKRILEPPCCFAGGLLSCMPAVDILDGILPQNMAHFNEI